MSNRPVVPDFPSDIESLASAHDRADAREWAIRLGHDRHYTADEALGFAVRRQHQMNWEMRNRQLLKANLPELPIRVITPLASWGYVTREQIESAPDHVLLTLRNVGPKAVAVLRQHIPYRESASAEVTSDVISDVLSSEERAAIVSVLRSLADDIEQRRFR